MPIGLHTAQEQTTEVERLLIQNIIRHGEEVIYKGVETEDGQIINLNVAQYIDYDLDLRIFPKGDYRVLDKLEYEYHRKKMNYSDDLDKVVKNAMKDLIIAYENNEFMFNNKQNLDYLNKYLIFRAEKKSQF